jgi:predicted outer membrane repeat protein
VISASRRKRPRRAGSDGPATVTSSTFRDNISVDGSGGGLFADTGSTLHLQGDLFIDNSAVDDGGAISAEGTTSTVTNTEIRGNAAHGSGGGLFADGVTLTVLDSTVAGNTAAVGGGGIQLNTTGTGATGSTITNTTIAGNSALNSGGSDLGGGIGGLNFGADLLLLNDTITTNYAVGIGGGVFWTGNTGVFKVENTIIAQNTAGSAPDIFDTQHTVHNFTDLGGNLIGINQDGDGFSAASGSQIGTAANPIDPRLSDLQNNGGPTVGAAGDVLALETEALLSGSPAIGRGVNAGAPATDERGLARPGGATLTSVGAFEPQTFVRPSADFVIGLDNQVYGRHLDANGNPSGGYFLTAPGQVKALQVARDGDNGLELFVIGLDNQVWAQTFDHGGNPSGGYFLTTPGQVLSITVPNSFLPEVFAVGLDSQVYEARFDASGRSTAPFGLVATGHVKSFVVGSYAGFQEGFAIGLDNQVYAVNMDVNGNPTSGYFLGKPGAVLSISLADTRLPEVFVLGLDHQVYEEQFDSNGQATVGFGLVAAGAVKSFVVGNFGGFQELFAIGLDDQVYGVKLDDDGNPTSGYFGTQPGRVQSLALGHDGAGRPELFVQEFDAQVYTQLFDGTGASTGAYALTTPGQVRAFAVR